MEGNYLGPDERPKGLSARRYVMAGIDAPYNNIDRTTAAYPVEVIQGELILLWFLSIATTVTPIRPRLAGIRTSKTVSPVNLSSRRIHILRTDCDLAVFGETGSGQSESAATGSDVCLSAG